MTVPRRKPFHLAIVGGGITGLTLAIALQKRNISCTIYEQAGAFGEIGAGVGMHENAVRAMRLIDPAMLAGFHKIATVNAWPSKRHVWFDFFDGHSTVPATELKPAFSVTGAKEGHAACHRAKFLDELVKLLPVDIARFNKRLRQIVDRTKEAGKVVLEFEDGSSAEADAVIGCDGLKSRTREVIMGEVPEAKCRYSHKFCYRGLIDMEDATRLLGEEKAVNASLWMGQNRHVLTFAVNHGRTLNLVAFVTNEKPWPSDSQYVLPATREDMLADFEGFGPNVLKLIEMAEKTDRWGLHDLAHKPLKSFHKGRVCLVGDAAHASTPHHGAGAGFCIEDVCILAHLLEDECVAGANDLEAAFAAFDANRKQRDDWLVQSSRRAADIYEWRELGKDFEHMKREIDERQAVIWNINLDKEIKEARQYLRQRLDPSAWQQ